MRTSRGMGDINPKKDPGRSIRRKDASEPVEVFAKGGWVAAKKSAKAAKAPGKRGAEAVRGFI